MLPDLDFTATHFLLRYRASAAPQRLAIHVFTDRPPSIAHPQLALPFLVEAINLGAGGGAELPPSAGAARVVFGPLGMDPPAEPGRYSWELEVAGVSPRFLRYVVERLSDAGDDAKVTAMTIVGSLPLDDSPLSVTEAQMRAWLSSSDAYPGSCPTLGFPVRDRVIGRGAAVRLHFGADVDHALLLQVTRLIEIWNQATLTVLNASGEYIGVADAAPRMSRGRREITAGYDAFDFLGEPTRAALLNMLQRFHEQVAPIQEAQIALA